MIDVVSRSGAGAEPEWGGTDVTTATRGRNRTARCRHSYMYRSLIFPMPPKKTTVFSGLAFLRQIFMGADKAWAQLITRSMRFRGIASGSRS